MDVLVITGCQGARWVTRGRGRCLRWIGSRSLERDTVLVKYFEKCLSRYLPQLNVGCQQFEYRLLCLIANCFAASLAFMAVVKVKPRYRYLFSTSELFPSINHS